VQVAVPRCPGSCSYKTAVASDPVLVLSKKKKRPVKRNTETESPAKSKKAKRASVQGAPKRKASDESPDSSQSSTGNVQAVIAEMGGSIPPRTADATAPFTPDTPNLCLWANAAFDLLHKLQWQRISTSGSEKPGANLDEILTHALTTSYKCPSCQETYGQAPAHREDCDLKLLLEQGGASFVVRQYVAMTDNDAFCVAFQVKRSRQQLERRSPAPRHSTRFSGRRTGAWSGPTDRKRCTAVAT
jgi:hypothetical protein